MQEKGDHTTESYELPDEGYLALAAAILDNAIATWRVVNGLKYPHGKTHRGSVQAWYVARRLGYGKPHEDLLEFFHSDWCELLCSNLNVDRDAMMQRHDIPPKEVRIVSIVPP